MENFYAVIEANKIEATIDEAILKILRIDVDLQSYVTPDGEEFQMSALEYFRCIYEDAECALSKAREEKNSQGDISLLEENFNLAKEQMIYAKKISDFLLLEKEKSDSILEEIPSAFHMKGPVEFTKQSLAHWSETVLKRPIPDWKEVFIDNNLGVARLNNIPPLMKVLIDIIQEFERSKETGKPHNKESMSVWAIENYVRTGRFTARELSDKTLDVMYKIANSNRE